ncbi:MAG: exodeoxyribonuclease VII small subunit [Alphaproteobacteria bacterium]|jgi:exodeoxyribonuclease VII small subunit|nr:exodeoxyribonuclease VII small subunit [Rhodospirillaceae bacterium]MBT5496737.1 exodeoxyribonuclease VII small subunit [Alphaproteobacteria bacterium]
MAKNEIPEDIAKLSFEDALQALEEIVKGLESGDVKLDQAIDSYARGAALKRHCESKLREAQAKIEKISLDADGTPRTEPANLE